MYGLNVEQARALRLWPRGVVVSRTELTRYAIDLRTVASLVRRGFVEVHVPHWSWRRLPEDPAEPARELSPTMAIALQRIINDGGTLSETNRLQVHLTTLRALQRRGLVSRCPTSGRWSLTGH